jgi:hypothetical protein
MREKISEGKVYLKAKKINQWDWPPVNLDSIPINSPLRSLLTLSLMDLRVLMAIP